MEEMTKLAHENFARWSDALQTGDPEQVAALYAKDCVFLPTMDPNVRTGKAEAEKYFGHFLQKLPIGTIIQDEVRKLSDTTYLHAGNYDFEVGPVDDRSIVNAKFTFIWKLSNDGWEILHHNSAPLFKG